MDRYALIFNRGKVVFGSHQFTIKTGISQKDFDNRNNHEYLNINADGSSAKDSESIQHPVRTRSFFAQLQDNVTWNDIFSSQLGIRYDWDELVPQDLNAICRACSSTPPSNTFQSVSGSLGFDAQLNDIWKIGYNISTGSVFQQPQRCILLIIMQRVTG